MGYGSGAKPPKPPFGGNFVEDARPAYGHGIRSISNLSLLGQGQLDAARRRSGVFLFDLLSTVTLTTASQMPTDWKTAQCGQDKRGPRSLDAARNGCRTSHHVLYAVGNLDGGRHNCIPAAWRLCANLTGRDSPGRACRAAVHITIKTDLQHPLNYSATGSDPAHGTDGLPRAIPAKRTRW